MQVLSSAHARLKFLHRYGAPSDAASLNALLACMRSSNLANVRLVAFTCLAFHAHPTFTQSQGFDPGPSLSSPPDVWSALAAAALSFVQFYPNGGDFEVGDGDAPDLSNDVLLVRASLRSAYRHLECRDSRALKNCNILQRLQVLNASVVTSIGFGEYGYALASAAASATQHCARFPAFYPRTCMMPCSYYFHCLSTDVSWFHSVYPNASDFARHAHDIKPQGIGGVVSL